MTTMTNDAPSAAPMSMDMPNAPVTHNSSHNAAFPHVYQPNALPWNEYFGKIRPNPFYVQVALNNLAYKTQIEAWNNIPDTCDQA